MGSISHSCDDGAPYKKYQLKTAPWFLFLCTLVLAMVAFVAGWIAHLAFLSPFNNILPSTIQYGTLTIKNIKKAAEVDKDSALTLPVPEAIPGKDIPLTTYTSKTTFIAGMAARTSDTVHIKRSASKKLNAFKKLDKSKDVLTNNASYFIGEELFCDAKGCTEKTISNKATNIEEIEDMYLPFDEDDLFEEDGSHEEIYLPAGQHLLVDIKNVDSSFLDSEHDLANSMISLVEGSQLTLLSYHCHSLVPIGVSCIGVLLESHISFHTWPSQGVIALDLFTCGSKPLIPLLPDIERLFAISRTDLTKKEKDEEIHKPSMLWAHKLRGFREEFSPSYQRKENPLDLDLGREVLGKLDFDMKKSLASLQTKHHHLDIYEVIQPRFRSTSSYEKSLSNDESYESCHPELYRPDRLLYVDGIFHSSIMGGAPLHEALVHPPMLAHTMPKRVAIVGGEDGTILREVMKHRVDEVRMFANDEIMMTISREYFPEWSDCSDIVGRVGSCFDDDRVVFREELSSKDLFDVIIVDQTYFGSRFVNHHLYDHLAEGGVLAIHLGKDISGLKRDPNIMAESLSGFEPGSIHIYDEGHSNFRDPWVFLVAFKDIQSVKKWYRQSAEIEIQIQNRLKGTVSGAPALKHFDASTMIGYQLPSKALELIEGKRRPEIGRKPDEMKHYRMSHDESATTPACGKACNLLVSLGQDGKSLGTTPMPPNRKESALNLIDVMDINSSKKQKAKTSSSQSKCYSKYVEEEKIIGTRKLNASNQG